MPFGYQQQPRTMIGNTAPLTATLYALDDENLVPQGNITSVHFTVVAPSDDPSSPSVNAAVGTVPEDGIGQYVVATTVNTEAGDYKAIATFAYDDPGGLTGLTKSIPCDYKVDDPFLRTGVSPADTAVRQAWMFLEDCFDSEYGGPWLRDMTKAVFDETKLRGLIPQVLLTINQQMPLTNYTESSFPYVSGMTPAGATEGSDGQALFALGLLCQAERQLMRAYVEQPVLNGSPVAYEDRTRYQASWQAMYAIDNKEFMHWLNRWKLSQYSLSSGSLLIGSKAGRMLPGPMRSRNVGRGF